MAVFFAHAEFRSELLTFGDKDWIEYMPDANVEATSQAWLLVDAVATPHQKSTR
jgi:hypothetical protein